MTTATEYNQAYMNGDLLRTTKEDYYNNTYFGTWYKYFTLDGELLDSFKSMPGFGLF